MAEPPEIGDILAEKYRVEVILGKGAMAMVLGARHLGLDEPVAIKLLRPEMLDAPGMVERFVREARAASKIKSEHVVRVTDVDMLKNGLPFMIMERLEGADLAAVCQERGQLPVEEAVGYILDACEALAEVHALGIVHRDLKPANLFLARRPDGKTLVKVLDFGISKVNPGFAGASYITTAKGALLGSPSYMSPEQMESASDVDPRTDIWALGAILYRLLTGDLPFRGESTTELIKRVLTRAPRRPRKLRPDLPKELEAVILRCLQKNRARRFTTVSSLAAALAPFAGERASGQRSIPAPPDEAARQSTALPWPLRASLLEEAGEANKAAPRRSRARLSALAAAGVLLLLFSVVGVSLWLRAPASSAPPAPLNEQMSNTTPASAGSSIPTAPRAVELSPSRSGVSAPAGPSH
jgi:eukaryotic-like serine/threonine-protein kinase